MANAHKYIVFGILFLLIYSSCVSIEKVKTGEQALDRKQYSVAKDLLIIEYEQAKGSNKAKKAYLLGDAYYLTNEMSQALNWYEESYERGFTTPYSLWKLAICYKQNEKYTKAIEVLELIEKTDDDNLANQATREARICLQAIEWNKRPTKFKIEKLPVRGSGSNYFSDILPDGNLVISSDHKTQDNKKSYKWTGRHFSKIYLIHPQSNGQFTRVEGWPLLSYHEGSATFNDAYNEVVFTICNKNKIDENHCQLVSSKKINGRWTQPTLLAFVKENINYGHPFIHRDSLLFFSCNDPSGMGNYDIYFSTKKNGAWSQVSALPSPINSPGNEKFPTAVEDSLFFSSIVLSRRLRKLARSLDAACKSEAESSRSCITSLSSICNLDNWASKACESN